jgi:hypothetical protein
MTIEEFNMLLSEMIKLQAINLENVGLPKTVYSLVANNGIEFLSKPRPDWVQQGTPKECFSNAAHLAMSTGLIYVEGFIFRIIPIHHAWCVDEDGTVIDPTLADQHTMPYFGIPFDSDFLLNVLDVSGMYGIMDNHEFRRIYDLNPAEFLHEHWLK